MTPAQVRLLAEHSLAALAAGAGLSAETVRHASDANSAPRAEWPAAGLRRFWLWALDSVSPRRAYVAQAAGTTSQVVARAVRAVEAWHARSDAACECGNSVAELVEGMAAAITEGEHWLSMAGACVVADRQELRRRNRGARQGTPVRTRDIHRQRPAVMGL